MFYSENINSNNREEDIEKQIKITKICLQQIHIHI